MKYKLTLALLALLAQISLSADPVLTFFFRDYPALSSESFSVEKFRKPHSIAKRTIEGVTQHNRIAGIFSCYFGFLNASNQNGQTSFPRKQSNPALKILITDKISPVMMFQTMVSHWELVPGSQAELYNCTQKTDDSTKLSFWEIEQGELPNDKIISPTDTLIIFAKPKNIYVPTGITLAPTGANLILPDMYVKKGIQSITNALYVLNFSFLFRPIDLLYKKAPTYYESLVDEE